MDDAPRPAQDRSGDDPGLSQAEAAARLAADGPNALPESHGRGAWRLLRDVATEPMLLLLLACGAVYMARGDLVLLEEGDRVPADLALVRSSNLMVDESLLTGESAPAARHAPAQGTASDDVDARGFAGTLVTQGNARAVVTATGAASALGRIGASLAGIATEPTPIQRETRRIVVRLALAALATAALLGIGYAWRLGSVLQGLLGGLTLAMAIIPEELPVVLTLFLALGAWRLARAQVLARRIPAVEALGAATVLCVDKRSEEHTSELQSPKD